MYKIGDNIVYPMYGAGTITAIEEKEMLDKVLKFYILTMPITNLTLSIPVGIEQKAGIRNVISREDGHKILSILSDEQTSMPLNWTKRFKYNMEILKNGDPFEIAALVRNLQLRENEKGLSTSEKKMLTTGKKILVSELVIVGSLTEEQAKALIDLAIDSEVT